MTSEESAGVVLHTRIELKKFDDEDRLLETIVMEDGKPTERIIHASD